MTSTLRVLLGERWPEPADTHWVVIDEAGQVTNSGHGEPREWPLTDRTEVVLHGPQTSWLSVKVPKAGEREQALALGFALEEQMVREADSQHATPTLRESESWHVIVTSRERLKRLTTQFDVISRPLDAAYSILQTLPLERDAWSLGVDDHGVVVRASAHAGWVEDLPGDAEAPCLLALAISDAREAAALPARIVCYGGDAAHHAAWGEAIGMVVEPGERWAWYEIGADADDLLHGEFLPRHRRKVWQRAIRPAAITLAIILASHLILGTGYALWRRAELKQIGSSMEKLMRTVLPNEPIADPVAQIKRELNAQRNTHGRLADTAALALIADFAVAMGPEAENAIQVLRYQDGGLDITLSPERGDLSAIKPRLEARGLSVTQRDGPGHIVIRRAL
jgi:general secretion pathway protein L